MSYLIDDRRRRELWAIGLLLLALLVTLSLVPVAALGASAASFTYGNVVGRAGVWLHDALWAFLGFGALGVPVLAALWSAAAFDRLQPVTGARWTALLAGAMAIFPAAAFVLTPGASGVLPAAGWLGSALGGLLGAGMGGVGGALVLFFCFAALSVATVGWNPLRTMVRGGRASLRGAQNVVAAVPAMAEKLPRPTLGALGRRASADDGAVAEDGDEAGWDEEDWSDEAESAELTGGWQQREWDDAAEGPGASRPRSSLADDADEDGGDVGLPWDEDPAALRSGESIVDRDRAWDVGPGIPFGAIPGQAAAGDEDTQPFPGSDAPVAVEPGRTPDAAPAGRKPAKAAEPEPHHVLEDTGDPSSADRPTTGLLDAAPPRDELKSRDALDALGKTLIEKLATFKIEGRVVGMTTGPVVTQFEVEPAAGVKVARIASLDADLALAMKATSIRIVAPIPGKGAVGVEVPNAEPEMVFFREVIESPTFRASKATLPLALGKDIAGKPYIADLAKMPHLLIAGATGSGKSVCVNTIITSLVYRHSPQTLRFLMVDPKMVELSIYNDLPHLRHPVVVDNNDAATVLKWAVLEMERRYALLSENGVRNLGDFNTRVDSGQLMKSPEATGEEGDPERWVYRDGKLPYIVVIIDELADLMMTVQGEVEKPLALLAQKARAIGIHLILATQRPSVNVITGLIKANFPSRIAFRVSSKVDSRTILDQNGADNLLGNGDMLLLPPASSEPVRLQGAYLSTEETDRLMRWFREQKERAIAEGREPAGAREGDILDEVRSKEGSDSDQGDMDEQAGERDKLFRDAAEICIQQQGGSTSLLQRRLRIGYGRAARVIDQLHAAGILGPPDGSKPRDVLVDFDDLARICGD
ncbi:MAG TPA: DNA translocase FtsK 4TM domain-containing protein [Longimicrobiaceae bacterium]|nr:DNA translocase FtsK 4TM domain-containing protein [Longimicrobiaceae bacterium]